MAEPGLVELPGPYGGHPGSVFTVAYSPDGSLLASGGWDGTVRLWNPRDGTAISVLTGHAGPVRSVAFAPDGTFLASCGRDQTIRLWDTVARTSAGVLLGHPGTVLAVAFAPGQPLLASADDEGTIRLWNLLDGTELDELADDARSLAFSPDGRTLASAGRDGKIRLWRPGDHAHSTIGAHTGPVLSLAFAPGRPLLASTGDDGSVRLWNPLDGTQIDELPDNARSLAFSPDGRVLASAGHVAGVVLWDLENRPRSSQLDGARRSHGLAFAPDGTQLASANDAGDVCVYDLGSRADPTPLVGHTCEILSVACSPDGALLATGDVDGAIRIWETTRGALVRRLVADREWVRSLAFNRAGTQLAAAIGGHIHVWAVTREWALISTLGLGPRPVTSVAFGPEDSGRSLLVSADDDGRLASRNVRNGSAVATSLPAVSVATDPGGTMVIGVGGDGFVRQWDLDRDLTPRQVFSPALNRPRCVALRPDGQALAGAGSDGTIMLWKAADSAVPVAALPGHDGAVRALAFSPDGALLASAGDDGTIRLWDARDGSTSRILTDRTGVVRSVAFVPDGATLVSVGDDGRINRWNPLSGRPRGSGARHPQRRAEPRRPARHGCRRGDAGHPYHRG
jgi:WD40 repeat protein